MPTIDLGPCECCGTPNPCSCQQLDISNVELSFSFSSAAFQNGPTYLAGFASQIISFWNGLTVPFREDTSSASPLFYHAACVDGTNQAGLAIPCSAAPGTTNCDSGPYLAYRNPVFEQITTVSLLYDCTNDSLTFNHYPRAYNYPGILATSTTCDVGVDNQVNHWATGQLVTARNYLTLSLSTPLAFSGALCGSAQSTTLTASVQNAAIANVRRPYGAHPERGGNFMAAASYTVTGSISLSLNLTDPLP